jgi:hypothetical protein
VDTAYRVSPLCEDDPERLGGYVLAGRLGSGGMGVVYLGRDPDGSYAAVKTVHAVLARQAEFQQRFRTEVARIRQVPSFCTAELLDADLEHDPPYLVIEYVDGPTLADVVRQQGPLRAGPLQSLAIGVATALSGIHGAEVIHRDLKPENVLLPPGNVKVIDFGIARAFDAISHHTGAARMIGTVEYMAPERIDVTSQAPVTPAVDVFAWGCVVAYAATGRSPFLAESSLATGARILTQPPDLTGLDEPLRGIVEAALVKQPELRPSARELLDLLLSSVANAAVALQQPTAAPGWAAPAPARKTDRAPAGARRTTRRPRIGRRAMVAGAGLVLAATAVTPALLSARDHPASGQNAPGAQGAPAPGAGVLIQDGLKAPSRWRNTQGLGHKAKCTVQDVLTVVRTDRKSFMCSGSEAVVTDGFSAQVSATLQSKGSCAALWFHWNPGRGGDILRICPDALSVAVQTADGTTVVGSIRAAQPIRPGWTAHIRIAVENHVVRIFRGGDLAGQVQLPPDSPSTGKIRLGIEVQPQGGRAPFIVAFSNLEVRAL